MSDAIHADGHRRHRRSLNIHTYMYVCMYVCMYVHVESERKKKEDRQKQSLKEGKAHTACAAGSNASQKSKGTGMANSLALLGTGDDGGSEQEDE
jgi:hypothetical protein